VTGKAGSFDHSHIAAVDRAVFHELDGWLGRWLHADGTTAALEDVMGLVARNPIEGGPLRALGSDGSEDDLRERLDILRRAYPSLKRYKDELTITASLLPEMFELYIPIARFMQMRSRQITEMSGRAALFGINGAQGSGKTTINAFLQIILSEGCGCRVAGLSIDDFYKTCEEREAMGREVHPLFAIRSVAGTHDTVLARATLTSLMRASSGEKIALPRFDKMALGGKGDRLPAAEWPLAEGPVAIVIFEGWCVGAGPEPESALATPVNEREAREDPDGIWRRTVNRLLATDYAELFGMIDELMVIQVQSMAEVFRNRELQEQHLRRRLEDARRRGEDMGGRGAMSAEEVAGFVSLYERTTRHMLATLHDAARLTLYIGEHHRIERLRVNCTSPAREASRHA
jgi:D-glycerate 3-kinase